MSECSFLRRDSSGKSRAMDYYEDPEYFDESFEEGSASLISPDNQEVSEHVPNRVSLVHLRFSPSIIEISYVTLHWIPVQPLML